MIHRHIAALVQQSLAHFPIVLVNGARQAGKSTLVKQLVSEQKINAPYVTLDDLTVLTAAKTDPVGFLSQFADSVVIDEVQRAPELLVAIKKQVDENRKPGRFLLTGSANLLSYPGVTESLAGRMDIIPLEGLSYAETCQMSSSSSFLQDIFSQDEFTALFPKWKHKLLSQPVVDKTVIREHLFWGGFPEVALKKEAFFRERWFSAYQTAYIERDVRDLSRLIDFIAFGKCVRLVANRTAQLLNLKNLSMDLGIDQRTLKRYVDILILTFQASTLIPWYSNANKRFLKTPKIYFNDVGLAGYFTGLSKPFDVDSSSFCGALFETWVWSELRKALGLVQNVQSFFYRTHAGKEVDFVLVRGGSLCGMECKWVESVNLKDFDGLKDLQEAAGNQVKGIVLYTGQEIVPFSKTLIAVPIGCFL